MLNMAELEQEIRRVAGPLWSRVPVLFLVPALPLEAGDKLPTTVEYDADGSLLIGVDTSAVELFATEQADRTSQHIGQREALERIAHLDETEGAGDVGAAMSIARHALQGESDEPKGTSPAVRNAMLRYRLARANLALREAHRLVAKWQTDPYVDPVVVLDALDDVIGKGIRGGGDHEV